MFVSVAHTCFRRDQETQTSARQRSRSQLSTSAPPTSSLFPSAPPPPPPSPPPLRPSPPPALGPNRAGDAAGGHSLLPAAGRRCRASVRQVIGHEFPQPLQVLAVHLDVVVAGPLAAEAGAASDRDGGCRGLARCSADVHHTRAMRGHGGHVIVILSRVFAYKFVHRKKCKPMGIRVVR